MEIPSGTERLSDRRLIGRFLKWVQQFLAEIVETGTDDHGNELFISELRLPMQAAWAEMDNHFDGALRALEEVPDEELSRHGLQGQQLRFKISVAWRISQLFRKFGGRSILRWLLKAIDTPLRSILEALGVGGAITEFKEAVENSVDMASEYLESDAT